MWCFNCDVHLHCSWVVDTGEAVLILDLEYHPQTLAYENKHFMSTLQCNMCSDLVVNRIPYSMNCSMSLCFRAQVVVASRGLLIRSAMFSCAYRSHCTKVC